MRPNRNRLRLTALIACLLAAPLGAQEKTGEDILFVKTEEDNVWATQERFSIAIQRNAWPEAQKALSQGANPNIALPDGNMAINVLARHGHQETLNLLINAGANVRKPNSQGTTALMDSARNGHEAAFSLLWNQTGLANAISHKDNNGRTVLHHAVLKKGNPLILQQILNAKINVNEQDKWGKSALHYAMGRADVASATLLRAKGAKSDITDKFGITPIMQGKDSTYPHLNPWIWTWTDKPS